MAHNRGNKMKTEIFENYKAFLTRKDKNTNGVSAEFAEENPEYEKQNENQDHFRK